MVQVRLLMDLLDEEAAVRHGLSAHNAQRNSLASAPHAHFAETIKANSDPHRLLAPPRPSAAARESARQCRFRLRVLDGTASARMGAAVSAAS